MSVVRVRASAVVLLAAVLVAAAFAVVGRSAAAGVGGGMPGRLRRAVMRLAARGLPVFCAGGGGDEVALSFDDGPTAYSARLVSELRGRAPATFFSIGRNASASPARVRAEARLGAVGDHTETHAILTGLPARAVRAEIVRGEVAVEAASGTRVWLFRPPGDDWDLAIDRIARELGLLAVGYTVDPRDWTLRTPAQVAHAVLSDPRLVPGAIVLLHETSIATVKAMPAIIAALHRRRLKLVTVPRLLADHPPTVAEQEADLKARSCVHLYQHRFGSG